MATVNATPGYSSFVLQQQSGVPLILMSSGSIGNNGALTGVAALPFIYPNCYVYCPAEAIVAGSAAGWYYAVMSSTTAGTIYNNTYSSGKPTIPASPTAFVTTGPGAFTQTTNEVTAITASIPGGALGSQGRFRMRGYASMRSTADDKTIKFKYGSAVFVAVPFTTSLTVSMDAGFANVTASRQIFPAAVSGASYAPSTSGTAATLTTEDTSVTATAAVTLQLENAADFVAINSISFETLYSA